MRHRDRYSTRRGAVRWVAAVSTVVLYPLFGSALTSCGVSFLVPLRLARTAPSGRLFVRSARSLSILPGIRKQSVVMAAASEHESTDEAAARWENKTILILGGGVIGVSIAYHLSLRGVKVTLVDRAGIASCASGKAGGFLARNWNDHSPVGALSRKSFDMHEEVAASLGLPSYRRLICKSVAVDGSGKKPAGAKLKDLEWTDLGVKGSQMLGDESTIAQVLPKELVDGMWAHAEQQGSQFRKGTVESLRTSDGRITGVVIDGDTVSADAVVLSMGPWGDVLKQVMPGMQMGGVKYHSVLMRTGRVLNEAVFFSGLGDPEVYPRNDGDTYVTGFPDPMRVVKEHPGEVEVREDVCTRLVDTMKQVSVEMEAAEVTKKQSCYLPFAPSGIPCMGLIPGLSNAYVATGHGCWGILNSLASGLAMSELILDGEAKSVDLAPFSPRYMGNFVKRFCVLSVVARLCGLTQGNLRYSCCSFA